MPERAAARIGGGTRLAGVVGWPVAHSRSPLLHNEWLRRAGIDGAYVPLPVAPGRLEVALHGLQAAGFAGVNVTIPHKEEACRLADTLTPAAARCGAVNTLVFGDDGRLHGDSTDGQGFLDSLRADGVDWAAGPALVLGAGGAARAIASALQASGVPVCLSNRSRARADALAGMLGGAGGMVSVIDWDQRSAGLGDRCLLVNTTSIGMQKPDADTTDIACALDRAPAGLVVADIVYVPRVTPLLMEARTRGLRTVGGLGMLLHQARLGFEAWFGLAPEIDESLVALIAADLEPHPPCG